MAKFRALKTATQTLSTNLFPTEKKALLESPKVMNLTTFLLMSLHGNVFDVAMYYVAMLLRW